MGVGTAYHNFVMSFIILKVIDLTIGLRHQEQEREGGYLLHGERGVNPGAGSSGGAPPERCGCLQKHGDEHPNRMRFDRLGGDVALRVRRRAAGRTGQTCGDRRASVSISDGVGHYDQRLRCGVLLPPNGYSTYRSSTNTMVFSSIRPHHDCFSAQAGFGALVDVATGEDMKILSAAEGSNPNTFDVAGIRPIYRRPGRYCRCM